MPAGADGPQFYQRPLPDSCVAFASERGQQIFARALAEGHMRRFFALVAQFQTQDEPAFCGLGSLAMALNTLSIDPGRVWKGVWRWYHEEMLDCCKDLEEVKTEGITLDEFQCLARCNGCHATVTRAADRRPASIEQFRQTVAETCAGEQSVLVCSYSRKTLGQTGSGHFSPVGGYSKIEDLVLLLDVARFKYPPHWVSLKLLWEAMTAVDAATGQPRGCEQANTPLSLGSWADIGLVVAARRGGADRVPRRAEHSGGLSASVQLRQHRRAGRALCPRADHRRACASGSGQRAGVLGGDGAGAGLRRFGVAETTQVTL